MLKSLFGDLNADHHRSYQETKLMGDGDSGFAATAILESEDVEMKPSGQLVDRHSSDLVVTGSPAAAIRSHFASTRADLDTAAKLITIIDPVGVWASLVVSAVSEACGQPVERLHLREANTLRTLATIERTTLVKQFDDMLKVVHADVRAPGRENEEIQVALMERSHITAIIVGPMQPHAFDALLVSLQEAIALPSWRCPNLLFMLPPNSSWVASKVSVVTWPSHLQVNVIDEPLTSASAVWNALISQWKRVKAQQNVSSQNLLLLPRETESSGSVFGGLNGLSASSALQPKIAAAEVGQNSLRPAGNEPLNTARVREAVNKMWAMEGLLGCAVVDSSDGRILARESREGQIAELDRMAIAGAQLLHAHRQAASSMGLKVEPLDEITCGNASRQILIRPVTRHPKLFMLALLDKRKTNLTLGRFKLMELDKNMG